LVELHQQVHRLGSLVGYSKPTTLPPLLTHGCGAVLQRLLGNTLFLLRCTLVLLLLLLLLLLLPLLLLALQCLIQKLVTVSKGLEERRQLLLGS
jgi:hypothetical protein